MRGVSMAVYEIVKFPNPVLTTPAKPVTKVTPNLLKRGGSHEGKHNPKSGNTRLRHF